MAHSFESTEFENQEKQRELVHAIFRNLKVTEQLIRADSNYVKYKSGTGETAFHYLIIESELDRAAKLLEWGSDINTQDYYGATPLISAATISQLETVKWLVARGANLELKTINKETALSWSTSNENASVFQYLIKLPRCHPIDFYYDDVTGEIILRDKDLVMRDYLVSLGLSERYGAIGDS